MKFRDLLASIRNEVLVEFSGRAALADYNPAARWMGRLCAVELARRGGEPAAPVEPLAMDEDAAQFAIEWLDAASEHFFCAAVSRNDPDLLRLAALLDKLRQYVNSTSAIPLQ